MRRDHWVVGVGRVLVVGPGSCRGLVRERPAGLGLPVGAASASGRSERGTRAGVPARHRRPAEVPAGAPAPPGRGQPPRPPRRQPVLPARRVGPGGPGRAGEADRVPARSGAPPSRRGTTRRPWPLSLIHISEPTRLLSISYAVF